MDQAGYGQVVPASDAGLLADSMLPGTPTEQQQDISSTGNALWSYKFEGKINGVQVQSADLGLMVDREDLLNVAFQLVCVPKSLIFWMSPDDQESIDTYNNLLKDVYDGKAIIVDELKQYDSTKCKFMVWVRYNAVSYALHPRFEYLREELNNGE